MAGTDRFLTPRRPQPSLCRLRLDVKGLVESRSRDRRGLPARDTCAGDPGLDGRVDWRTRTPSSGSVVRFLACLWSVRRIRGRAKETGPRGSVGPLRPTLGLCGPFLLYGTRKIL